jgi:prolyl oligopeptidase
MKRAALLIAIAACGGPSKSAPLPVETPTAMKPADPPVDHNPAAPDKPAPGPKKDFPATRRDDVSDTLHGVVVKDPYRWLEDPSKSDVQEWMKAQDDYARAHLAQLPDRDAIAARLTEVFYYDAVSAPIHRKERFFYTRKHKDKDKTIVYWKQGEKGAEKVLLDPNGWSTDGSAGLKGWWPSWDGKHVAYNKSEHNADETTMYVLDVATGKLLTDQIAGTKYSGASWTPDGKGFYYTWVPEPSDQVPVADRPGFAEIRFHALGSDPAKDPVVHEKTGDAKTFLGGSLSMDGHWLFAAIQHGWNSSDWYYKDTRKHDKDWTPLVVGVDANFSVDDYKDTFYVMTNDGAPRYRVFAVDPKKPARADWKEIVAQQDSTLESMSLVGGHLVLNYLRDAQSAVEVHDLHGALVRKVDVPPLGSASGMLGLPDEDTAYFSYTSYTSPQVIYKTSIKSGKVDEWARITLPIDTSVLASEQVRYKSKDGTEITMFLIHRKDAVKNGKTPVLLTGYGGFNVSMTPGFSSLFAVWLEHGGMVAIPNLRGGGEYGEEWHRAGMLLNKQNVFDDFNAAGKWLVDSGWTSRDELAIEGGSNGGLLMGAAITQAPEQWKAVVCAVPLLDMIRMPLFGSGKTWVPEYGSADDPEQFKALYAYSPYHHVVEGTRYPALLVSSSDHDDRVDPMHARKFAAEVQWATGGDAPVWLRIEKNAGHGGADVVKQQVQQWADIYAFLMWQLGMK